MSFRHKTGVELNMWKLWPFRVIVVISMIKKEVKENQKEWRKTGWREDLPSFFTWEVLCYKTHCEAEQSCSASVPKLGQKQLLKWCSIYGSRFSALQARDFSNWAAWSFSEGENLLSFSWIYLCCAANWNNLKTCPILEMERNCLRIPRGSPGRVSVLRTVRLQHVPFLRNKIILRISCSRRNSSYYFQDHFYSRKTQQTNI